MGLFKDLFGDELRIDGGDASVFGIHGATIVFRADYRHSSAGEDDVDGVNEEPVTEPEAENYAAFSATVEYATFEPRQAVLHLRRAAELRTPNGIFEFDRITIDASDGPHVKRSGSGLVDEKYCGLLRIQVKGVYRDGAEQVIKIDAVEKRGRS